MDNQDQLLNHLEVLGHLVAQEALEEEDK